MLMFAGTGMRSPFAQMVSFWWVCVFAVGEPIVETPAASRRSSRPS